MEQQNNQEEKQEIISDNSPGLQMQQSEQKDYQKKYFTTKCKWISFSVSFFVLAGIGIFLGIYLSQNKSSAPTLKKFQRDEFQQVDEICMQHQSNGFQNCTQIQMRTKRVVNEVNEKNASSLLILTGLKVQTFKQNSNGTREYDEMIDQNTEIEQQIKKLLRILQATSSTGSQNLCEGIPADECGNVNEVPLITVVTDQQTGAIQQIGVPAEVPDELLQPLVSNVIHIAPTVGESTDSTGSDGKRLLKEDYSNAYLIGKEVFIPKQSKTTSWFGNTVITKKVTKSDKIDGNSSEGTSILDVFEQSQETSLDNNNYLVSSHITTNSKFSNFESSDNTNESTDDDLAGKSETEITNDSNLITVETKSDEDLTNALTEIKNKQQLQYYSIQDLQDKIQRQTDQFEQNQSQQDQTQAQNSNSDSQGGSRLLENESGDVSSTSETQLENQQGECNSNAFNQKRTLKQATVFKQKIGLQAEFQGKVNDRGASGYLQACVSLNGDCVVVLHKRDFSYEGKPLQPVNLKGSKAQRIFGTVILIMGYPLTIGADYNLSWGFTESLIKTESELGISENIYASLGVTAYGELNIVYVVKIRAGVEGHVFKGSATGVAQFKFNQTDNSIVPNRYMVYLDFQIEALTFDLYASWQHISLHWVRRCIGRRWWKICWYYPQIGYSNWSDIFRKSFQLAKLQATQRIFQLASKCF
ncbi:unnamed protein product [Paramecium octaurelia]|uniref:Transmembrane protein n=1 Tax=Paramecium octaurelia TaxID=43137 RepID=A0A8S1S505_PAROT|nr:unnamed protein product [Paramecium octaurelia]